MSLYDQDNPDGPDHDFFRDLANRVAARKIVDLGEVTRCAGGS